MGVDNAHELNNLLSTPYFTEVGRHLFARPVTTVYLYTYFCHISTPVSSVMVITSFQKRNCFHKVQTTAMLFVVLLKFNFIPLP